MAEAPIRNNLVLELHVPDFEPVREFYGMFGFEEQSYDPTDSDPTDGTTKLGYLVLRRPDILGDTMLNFYGGNESVSNHSHFRDFPADTPRGYAVEITVPVSDVKGLWERVISQLVEQTIAQPLTMKRWGKQDFRVIDPHGFYVRFTEMVDWGQEET